MSAAIHGAKIMVQCSRNDNEQLQITLLHGFNILYGAKF